jgi:hypothetical protein
MFEHSASLCAISTDIAWSTHAFPLGQVTAIAFCALVDAKNNPMKVSTYFENSLLQCTLRGIRIGNLAQDIYHAPYNYLDSML